MNKTYKNMKSMLMAVDYHFENDNSERDITLETHESIQINSISDSNIMLTVARKLVFTGFSNTYLKVVYDVNISLAEKITKSKFEKDVRKGLSILGDVFSDISLIVAQVTDKSPFGAIISPPMYDVDDIEIK